MKNTLSKKMFSTYNKYIFNVAPFRIPIFAKGNGVYITDLDGNKYLDLMSGQFCLPFGHAYKPFATRVQKQFEKLTHTNTLSLTPEALAGMKALARLTKGNLNKTLLLSTGAEAVEAALRFAKIFANKNGIVGVGDGYHGLTLATQSISSFGQYARPKVAQTFSIPTPNTTHITGDKKKIEYALSTVAQARTQLHPYLGQIAAFVVEPVISVGGMIFPPREYFYALKQLATEHDALLIFDECQTGMGRTGKWFGYEHCGIVPDILILAKILGGGVPVSAIMVNDSVARKVENTSIHFSSHQNDPLSGAILEFVISHMKERKMLSDVNAMGRYFLSQLKLVAKDEPIIQNPRGLGLMLGFDLPQEYFSAKINPGLRLIALMEEEGVIIQAIKKGVTFRILPSYTIQKADIDLCIRKLRIAINNLKQEL